MRFEPPLVRSEFVSRPHRFAARCRLNGRVVEAHLANPGRMTEFLVPGAPFYLRRAANPARKLRYDVCLVRYGRVLVGMQSFLANDLVADAIGRRALPSLAAWDVDAREVRFGRSRVDFVLRHRTRRTRTMNLEVKSCTLVEKRHGLFPDAPTSRGTRHVEELAAQARAGQAAAILFAFSGRIATSCRPTKPPIPRSRARCARRPAPVSD
ncbi:MAG: DNA/RNA nuclease SfsA [Deltaproteobacteria bacterium]|nr:DNA/RNA nuclease SfsA [Deltaproteobacteria bacterium]